MKKLKFIMIFMTLVFFTGCEDVVDIDLDEGETRLVIEASIIWFKGESGQRQNIKITKTTPFYEEETIGVESAQVRITSQQGEEFNFIHIANGNYVNSNFNPIIENTYSLEVLYKGERYTASEKMIPVTEIDTVEQSASGGFGGDEIEIKVYYQDPEDQRNYYLFKFLGTELNLEIYEDEFSNGNRIFGYYSNEDLEAGDEIGIEMMGISRDYYDYLFILRSQLGTNEGGPFETMPATVKGNIINRTNAENYPFGYFRLSEADATTYTIQ